MYSVLASYNYYNVKVNDMYLLIMLILLLTCLLASTATGSRQAVLSNTGRMATLNFILSSNQL